MNDKEAIDMMQRCLHEIRSLRAQIKHLSPAAEAYCVLRDVVRMAAPANRGVATGENIIWTLEKRIRELEPKPKAESDDDPA
jgi:hypothetical protein